MKEQYQGCELGGAQNQHSQTPAKRLTEILEPVSVDIIWPLTVAYGKVHYHTLLTDSTSLYRHSFECSTPGGAGLELPEFFIYVQVQLNLPIKRLGMDNTKDYGGKAFEDFCRDEGIWILLTTPHNSTQTGRVEVSNPLVIQLARMVMLSGKVTKYLWAEAVKASTQLLKIMCSNLLGGKSPYNVVDEQQLKICEKDCPLKTNLSYLKAYCFVAYIYNNNVKRGNKFAPRAQIGKLVGWGVSSHNIYCICLPKCQKVFRSGWCALTRACSLYQMR